MNQVMFAVRRQDGAWLNLNGPNRRSLWVLGAPLQATWWSDAVTRRWTMMGVVQAISLKEGEEWAVRIDGPDRRGDPLTCGQLWEAVLRQVVGVFFTKEDL